MYLVDKDVSQLKNMHDNEVQPKWLNQYSNQTMFSQIRGRYGVEVLKIAIQYFIVIINGIL
jgi:hypothetical protein